MDQALRRAPFGVVRTDDEGTVTAVNEAAQRLLDVEDEAVDGAHVGAVFPHSVERTVAAAFEGAPPTEGREFEEYYPEIDRWFSVSIAPTGGGATVYLRDVTDRKDAERTEERLRRELERMTVIDGLVSEVLSELVGASTREEIAETICERLGETDLYEFAWVGERELGSDGIVVRASAGATGRTLERVRETLAAPETAPEERAVETGELQAVRPLADDPSVPQAIRQAAFADGLGSLLAIPLTYGSSVYGVVGVYAAGREAFSERERASFGTVGEIAGFAVNATRHRNLLLSDRVVEVSFGIGTADSPLAATAAGLDATVSLDGMVPREDGSLLGYVAVDGADPELAADPLGSAESVDAVRVVTAEEDGGVLEVDLDAETPLGLLSGQGATVRSATFEGGSGRVVAEFSPEEDVRRVADALARRTGAEVLAKRRREREVTTPTEFREELRDRLTDRQETALRTAFFAEYFESPRGSTAEEVAAALDVTGPTLLYHLRAGQRKLLETFFDVDSSDGPAPEPDAE